MSNYGDRVDQILTDLDTLLKERLELPEGFQPDPTVPGQTFGICDYQSWEATGNEFSEDEEIKFTIWIVTSSDSLSGLRSRLLNLTAEVRSLLPSIPQNIDKRNILMQLDYPKSVSATKRAPMTPPNATTQHLWIGDIVVPCSLKVAIPKSMCGEHRS